MKRISTTGLLILSISCFAQEYQATGKLEKPVRDGFYKIFLSPAEARYSSPGFSNIRILDSKNMEVPYMLTEEQPVYLEKQFKEYEILEKKQVNRAFTSIKLYNATKASINNIGLLIKNAEVSKTARLSGSDDGKTWFAVKENFTLNAFNNRTTVSELRGIEFPLTNYAYYLLEISDSTSAPLNVLKAGYYDVAVTNGLFTRIIDSVSTTAETKDKRTHITLKFSAAQVVDKLELRLTGSPFFQRSGTLTQHGKRKVKNRYEEYDVLLSDFVVRSGQILVINLRGYKTDNLTFHIENGDNPGLSIQSLQAYQLNRYVIAWLKKDEGYTVRFGSDNEASPDYDLDFFRDSIPGNASVLNILELKPVETQLPTDSPTFFTSKTIIWIAIGAVIALLGFMSLKLVRETNDSEKNRHT